MSETGTDPGDQGEETFEPGGPTPEPQGDEKAPTETPSEGDATG